MRVNRFMLIVGLVFALVGGGTIFVMNSVLAPAPALVVAAREDIPAGTMLIDIHEDQLVLVPLQLKASAQSMLLSLMCPEDLESMRASGGVLIQDVFKFEPIPLSAVVAADNPAAARLARLGMDDPDLMLVVISTAGTAPESVSAGDRVDLAVAVDQVRDTVVMDRDERMPVLPGAGGFTSPVNASPEDLLQALAEGSGIDLPVLEGTPTTSPTPTPTPLPDIREPLAKVLVHGAPIVRVIRERNVTSFTSTGDTNIALGDVIGLDVIIPRDAFEMVTMASSAGIIQIGVLSPLAADEQDLLNLFYDDRQALAPTPTPTHTPIPTTMPTPTATPSP